MKIHHPPLVALAAAALIALGCTSDAQKNRSPESRETPPAGTREGSDEASSTDEKLKEAGRDVKEAAKNTGQEIKEAAKEVGKDAKEAGGEMGKKVDAIKQLADVKMALMADPNVDASHINVDADEATKTIHLKGTVPTAAQKTAAERIARDKAQGYKIHNVLTVAK